MSSSTLLQRLRDLNSSSSEFHTQLTGVLLVEDRANQIQDLPYEDLRRLVEGLDRVCMQIASIHSVLNSAIGS